MFTVLALGSSDQVDQFDLRQPAERGESIKPGVERSGTPGLASQCENRAREACDSANSPSR